MLKKPSKIISYLGLAVGWVIAFGSCSSAPQITPLPAPVAAISPPEYAFLPHPPGASIADVKFLFTAKRAPALATLPTCDSEFRSVVDQTRSREEIQQAAIELIKKDPAYYHWCFYGKILTLDDGLKEDRYIDERQKRILTTYEFLVPIARAFIAEYRDSRYLRWAIRDYRRLSDADFFRRLEIAPKTTAEIVDAGNPYAGLDPYDMNSAPAQVTDKYKDIAPAQAEAEPPTPDAEAEIAEENARESVPVSDVDAIVAPDGKKGARAPASQAEQAESPTSEAVAPSGASGAKPEPAKAPVAKPKAPAVTAKSSAPAAAAKPAAAAAKPQK